MYCIFACYLFVVFYISDLLVDAKNITLVLDNLVQNYDKRLRPNYGGKPVVVEVTIYVSTISAVSEVQMDYTLDLYLRQYWRDPRLRFHGINESVTVGIDVVKSIWVPDTFFPNEKQSFFHEATTHNSFLRINKDGDISKSTRLTVTLNCPMNLEHFPMDRQNCSFEIESYGYSVRDIVYRWKGNDSMSISKDVHLAQFRVTNFDYTSRQISLSTGNYSRLTAYFSFERNIGFYLIQIYLPSSLIVIISWVSFWLNREATQARVAIGVTTVLTMTTLMTSTNSSMPKVSYVKSIDIYLGTCFIIVFASLLEYAAVGYLMKRMRMQRDRRQARVYGSIPLNTYQPSDVRLGSYANQTEISWTNEETGFYQISASDLSPRIPYSIRSGTGTSRRYFIDGGGAHGTASSRQRRNVTSPVMEWTNSTGKDGSVTVPLIDATSLPPYQNPPPAVVNSSGGYSLLECDCDKLQRNHKPPKPIRLRTKYQRQAFKPSNIDKYSRILFPLVFISFHIVYWTVYLNYSTVGFKSS